MINILFAIQAIENESERELVNRLFTEYAPKIKGMAYKIMGNQQDAEDALGNTFLKIIKYRNKFKNIDNDETTRLIVIYTRSACFDMRKKRDKFDFVSLYDNMGESEDFLSVLHVKTDVLEECIRHERIQEIAKQIRLLKSPAKEILLLKYYYNTPNTEIGDMLGINVSTVGTIIQRSTRKILKEMGEYSYDE